MKILKQLSILALLVCTVLTSCGNDEDSPTLNNSNDSILINLSDSKQKYKDANDGDWIQITEAEYDKLFTNLKETTKVGLKDASYPEFANTITPSVERNETFVSVNSNHWNKLPENSYLVAFKYSPKRQSMTYSATKVKLNSDRNDRENGFTDLGNVLPTHNGGKNACFVIKGNNTKKQNGGILACYCEGLPGFVRSVGDMYAQPSDSNIINKSYTAVSNAYQGIATTNKQW